MHKMYFNNGLRRQCLDVEPLCMEQFTRSVSSFCGLLPESTIKNIKRIVATGCGDSYLAAAEAKGAFAKYLPDVEYEALPAMEVSRYLNFEEQEPDTIVVGISVSGGPARVAEVLERGNKHGCTTVALTDSLSSRAASTAKYTYHTKTPAGDNISGLRTYYVSMISMYIMAAAMAEVRTGDKYLDDLKDHVEKYCKRFYQDIETMDDVCFEAALKWRSKRFFEVTADGPLFYCGKFISAKFAELSGDVCSVIDSENYFHVNSIMYPGENIGEMVLIASCDGNVSRIADTVNSQVTKHNRSVIVFCDKRPDEIGITESVSYCPMPVPEREYSFLIPLFAYIPAAILASYRATTIGEPFFRGGATRSHMTLGTNPIKVI